MSRYKKTHETLSFLLPREERRLGFGVVGREGGGGTSDATKEIVTFEVGNKLSFPENVIFIGEFNGEERRRNIENRRRNGKGKKRGNGRKGMTGKIKYMVGVSPLRGSDKVRQYREIKDDDVFLESEHFLISKDYKVCASLI